MNEKLKYVFLILFAVWLTSYLIVSSLNAEELYGNVALIRINAPIQSYSESLFSSYISPEDVTDLLERAEKLPNIKAVLLEINSGGGSAVSCEEIVKKVSSMNKTVVSLIKDIGASGAYWIAASSDYIIASRASIVGSIGTYSSYLEFSGLMEKYGVYYRRLVEGEYKDIGTPFRNMSDEEQKIFEQRLKIVNDYFLNDVSAKRKLDEEQKKEVSSGLFYVGEQALKLNLIDEIGGKEEALKRIQLVINETPKIVELKKRKGFVESLYNFFSKQSFVLGYGFGFGFSDKINIFNNQAKDLIIKS
ncbi:MAG: signal peptide peptidase SppA [Candidatus Woesearchaeota archaeon]